MDFQAEWLKGMQAPHLALPPRSPVMIVYSDVGKRVSMCRVCDTPVVKGTARCVVLIRFQRAITYRSGVGRGQKFYCHPDCVASIIGDTSEGEPKDRRTNIYCVVCDDKTERNGPIYRIGNHEIGNMCPSCANDPKYTKCDCCGFYGLKYSVSRIVEMGEWTNWSHQNEDGVGKLACDSCAEVQEFVRVKDKNRQERADRKLERKLERIRALYEDEYGTTTEDGR